MIALSAGLPVPILLAAGSLCGKHLFLKRPFKYDDLIVYAVLLLVGSAFAYGAYIESFGVSFSNDNAQMLVQTQPDIASYFSLQYLFQALSVGVFVCFVYWPGDLV